MKTLLSLILLFVSSSVFADHVVFCYREDGNIRTFFKIPVEHRVDSAFLRDDLKQAGMTDFAIDKATVIIDMETKTVILDRRPVSKLHKIVPQEKLKLFGSLPVTNVEEINDHVELISM